MSCIRVWIIQSLKSLSSEHPLQDVCAHNHITGLPSDHDSCLDMVPAVVHKAVNKAIKIQGYETLDTQHEAAAQSDVTVPTDPKQVTSVSCPVLHRRLTSCTRFSR